MRLKHVAFTEKFNRSLLCLTATHTLIIICPRRLMKYHFRHHLQVRHLV